jgi:thiamine biosynthesis protein ThiI
VKELSLQSSQTIASEFPEVRLSGKAVFLISGGIDSPVAAWLLMRKGVEAVFAYFDNYPLCDQAAENLALETVRKLRERAKLQKARVYVVAHAPDLQVILSKCPTKFACMLSRRIMFRVAEEIAHREGCNAIVTGDAVGQKASQTLQNIVAADCVLNNVQVLRPLVGMNKQQIVKYAMEIGTYEVSIRPGVASCGVPTDNPSTSARRNRLAEVETALDIGSMVEKAVQSARVLYV